jgi:hypothetical protein
MAFLSSLKRLHRSKSARRSIARTKERQRWLRLEPLEDRCVLATFSVSSFGFGLAGSNLTGIVADDFNADGRADVAVASANTSAALVALGSGGGSLGPFTTYGTGLNPSDVFAIASGNLEGSPAPDLVVTSLGSGGFRVLANNGAGNFFPTNAFGVGSSAEQPVIADMNGDGFNDVVVGRFSGGGVNITYMNGSGSSLFNAGLPGAPVTGVTVGDFNGDGRRDIAAAGFGGHVVHVYLNQGPTNFPNFLMTTLSSLGSSPIGIASADLDGDSDLDLAVTNRDSNTVALLSNNGAGGFLPLGTVSTGGLGSSTFGIEAGDLDRDGDRDIVVALRNQNQIQVLRNNGGFSFIPESPINVPSSPFAIDLADFNNDRRLDIAVSHQSSVVSLLLNTTPTANVIDVTPDPRSTAVSTIDVAFNGPITGATFDRNDLSLTRHGGPNLITPAVTVSHLIGDTHRISGLGALTAAHGNYQLSINLANILDGAAQPLPIEIVSDTWTKADPPATFTANLFAVPTNNLTGIVADDFNVDGNVDVAVATGSTSAAFVAFGNGGGLLGPFATYGTGLSQADQFAIASGNLQGSPAPDLVVTGFSSGAFRILENNGAGNFSPTVGFGVGSTVEQPVIADMNGDGFNDVVVGRFSGGGVNVTYMNGSGGILFSMNLPSPTVIGVTIGDFNGDGRRDIAAAGFGGSAVFVYLNQGPPHFPNFSIASFSSGGAGPTGIVSADLDGDTDLDLAVTNNQSETVAFLSNNGGGGFVFQGAFSTGGSGFSTVGIETGDLDGDGDNDVIVALRLQNQIRVLRNSGGFNFVVESPINVAAGPFSLDVADFNEDGRRDIAIGHQSANVVTILLNTTPQFNQPPSVASNNGAVLGSRR